MRKRRGNSRYITIFITVILTAYLIYRLTMHFICKIDFFQINDISFNGNNAILTAELAEAALPLNYRNLFELKDPDIELCFKRFHRIDTLYVKRSLPDELQITIVEKIPVFHIKTEDGRIYSIDKDAVLIPAPKDFSKENLPFIPIKEISDNLTYGEVLDNEDIRSILEIQDLLKSQIPNFFIFFSEVFMDNKKITFVEAEQGYRIIFDEKGFLTSAKEYMKIKDTFSFDNKTCIDMRKDGYYRIIKLES